MESKAVEKRKSGGTIADMLGSDSARKQLAAALPKHITPERMIRVALTAINKSPQLLECTRESFWVAMLTCSQLGLEPDNRLAYLIPYRDKSKGTVICDLQIGYKGFIDLAFRSGQLVSIQSNKVYENDVFENNFGIVTEHRVNYREDRGEPIAFYALLTLSTGGTQCRIMGLNEVNRIRQASPSRNSDAWNNHPDEMGEKTVIKNALKKCRLSPELSDAIAVDDAGLESIKPAKVASPDWMEKPAAPEQIEAPSTPVDFSTQDQEPEPVKIERPPRGTRAAQKPAPEPEAAPAQAQKLPAKPSGPEVVGVHHRAIIEWLQDAGVSRADFLDALRGLELIGEDVTTVDALPADAAQKAFKALGVIIANIKGGAQ